jgi:hypothetical protein
VDTGLFVFEESTKPGQLHPKPRAWDLTDRKIEHDGLLHKNKLREILANVGNGATGRVY